MSEPFVYHKDPAEVEKLTRGQLLTYAQDIVCRRAAKIRALEYVLISLGHASGWDHDNAATHDVLGGIVTALGLMIAKGKDQVVRGVKVDPLIDDVVKAIRSSLISEITARSSRADEPAAPDPDEAAA